MACSCFTEAASVQLGLSPSVKLVIFPQQRYLDILLVVWLEPTCPATLYLLVTTILMAYWTSNNATRNIVTVFRKGSRRYLKAGGHVMLTRPQRLRALGTCLHIPGISDLLPPRTLTLGTGLGCRLWSPGTVPALGLLCHQAALDIPLSSLTSM